MRCPRCGNENPATNRFCGMCGATLLPPAPESVSPPRPVVPATPPPVAPVASTAGPRPAARVPERIPESRVEEEDAVISGPSFLGLNQPPPRQTADRRGSLDPDGARGSRNLDYLLEDEEPRHGGGWKAVVIFLALAAAVGLGYLRWKNQGFGWLNPNAAKHAAAPSADNSNAGTTPEIPPPAPTAQAPNAGATPGANPLAAATNPPTPSNATNANPATSTVNPADNGTTTGSATPPASSPVTDQNSPNTATDQPAAAPAAKQPSAAPSPGKDAGAASADDTAASAPAAPPAKPSAAAPAKPVDPVAEAQKYLYGKGVPQNCDRGLRILKPAADHANAKAMIEMGALYSAGLCTPRDLPTAYRWFAMALRKEPDNDSVQTDLQKLWGEMTQPERQLAIKLSQ